MLTNDDYPPHKNHNISTLNSYLLYIQEMSLSFLSKHFLNLIFENMEHYLQNKGSVPYFLNMHFSSSEDHCKNWSNHAIPEFGERMHDSFSSSVYKYLKKDAKLEIDGLIAFSSWMIDAEKRKIVTGKYDKLEAEADMRRSIADCISWLMISILPSYWKIFFTDSARYATMDDLDIPKTMMKEFTLENKINIKTNTEESFLNFSSPKEALRIRNVINNQYEFLQMQPPNTEVHCFRKSDNKLITWANFPNEFTHKILDPKNLIQSWHNEK